MARSVWRLDEAGRLRAPSGAVVARLDGGRLFFFDKRLGAEIEVPFTIADWWALVEGDLHTEEPKRGGVWGRRDG